MDENEVRGLLDKMREGRGGTKRLALDLGVSSAHLCNLIGGRQEIKDMGGERKRKLLEVLGLEEKVMYVRKGEK